MGRLLTAVLLVTMVAFLPALLGAETYETEMTAMAEKVSTAITKADRKKVSVLDFTDLQGNANELGRFLAEDLSVDLVIGRTGYSVLDRANLKNIIAEHKLTVSGLVDPENAKKLGQFAGVDAIVLGNITPFNDTVVLSVKIIATDTAEIVGAAKGQITKTRELEQLLSRNVTSGGDTPAATETPGAGTNTGSDADSGSGTKSGTGTTRKEFAAPSTIHKFPNFTVELLSFQIRSGHGALATLQINNTSKQTVMAFAANQDNSQHICAKTVDENGNILRCSRLEGLIAPRTGGYENAFVSARQPNSGSEWMNVLTDVAPNESIRLTLELAPEGQNGGYTGQQQPSIGRSFKLQMELITAEKKEGNRPTPNLSNVYLDGIVPGAPSPAK